jgi:hypothetical protein
MLRSCTPLLRRTLGSALFALAIAVPLAAQAGAEDQGTFRITVNGRPAGTEEFSIRQSGAGSSAEVIATGRIRLTLPTGSLELTPRLRATGLSANPISYEVTIGGDSPRKIVGTVGSGRFSAKIVSPSGEQLREYVASSGALILDDDVAHHYYFLAQRLRSGAVPILIPRENRQVMATVANRGEEKLTIGGTAATVYHLVVTPANGGERHVWVDDLNRVIRVEIPERGYAAVRTELPR